jgi:hypothetical protein
LDKHYVSWSNDVINNFRIKNELLRHVHIETNRQLKALKEYCNRVGYGSNRYNYIAKGIIFHSKFLYLTVLEYYEETNKKEESITICGNKIIIDSYAYVHILFRHYAAIVKEHQVDKSYHIGDFDHKQLPNEIFNILDKYAAIVKCDAFDKEKIFFKLNKTKYALWWKLTERQFKGKPKETVFRVETLYPVEAKRDLNKIAHLKETIVSDELSIFL